MEKILLVDKPIGWTSFDVVAKIRGAIKLSYLKNGIKPTKRQLKVGHAGTLDPFASGLLIILLGDACKQADDFLKLDKSYGFTAELGKKSSTGDTEGEVTLVSSVIPTLEQVEMALDNFRGTVTQVPPAYSAIKMAYEYPFVRAQCSVSSGTYIRTLAEDIGTALGVGAYCTQLRRISVGRMTVQDSLSIEKTVQYIASEM